MRGVLYLLIALITLNISAQEKCGTDAPSSGEFENWIQRKITERASRPNQPFAPIYQIPVVVHVFHKGEEVGTGVNLSKERIQEQIDSLTADFRRMNADAVNTPSEFLPVAADVEIEFVLAKQDPQGNPTNGIVRLQGSRDTYRANSHRPLLRSESYWPAERYLNIFVLDLEVFLGYASFPLTSIEGITNDSEDYIFDGVLIDYQYIGVNPAAPAFESYGRTLTHEVGHYLGLRHIWGDGGCTVDDFVNDTPVADTDNGDYTSPCTFPNPSDPEVCVSGEPEMFQNFMDYTDDICMNLFTEGQKTRMRTVMDNAQNRTTLINSAGLIEPSRVANDLAATRIQNPEYAICTTNIRPELTVTNYGTNSVSSYKVQLRINGNPIGAPLNVNTTLDSLDSETIAFNTQSVPSTPYTISFEITEVNETADGNSSNNIISRIVSNNTAQRLPFNEDFESVLKVLGESGSNHPWEIANAPKNSPSNQAFIFKAYNNSEWFGETTIFKTPVLDLTGIQSGEMLFSFAHANVPSGFYDGLMVKASVDCGETFPDILFSSFGPNLSTAVAINESFVPANQLEWIDTLLSITDYKEIDGVQFAFVGINGGGNNIYIDDISIIETNLFENDINPRSLNGPLITCSESSRLELRIRNVGSQNINSFEVKYYVNGDTTLINFNGLNISSKDFASFFINTDNLLEGTNNIGAEITLVNGVEDESEINNSLEATLFRDAKSDEYPLVVDFEQPDTWDVASGGNDTLWVRSMVDGNGVLRANGFNAPELGIKNWFISPKLSTGKLDSAKLYFRASHATRDGFSDRLQVLLSTDCGENYSTTLLDAFSDSLAVTNSATRWTPSSDNDWKTYELNLSHSFFFDDNIRIAFVFTPGGGNDLFIDDINIREGDLPNYEDVSRVYPNPAINTFNVGFNLLQKESITIRLLDISGRIVFEENIGNALNQVIEYKAPSQSGLYFINVIGNEFNSTQKLFISR
ncbi:choice-of-anchor J domain-containing protein [Ekhidna sp.]|uniref:T9SS-dependent choice-of-anchor J family protein n=2 Tax=Ekhidna sp. TaxID=2608089 RepID=UPI003298C832